MEDLIMNLKGTETEKNLLLAFHGESNNRNLYTYFADQAKEEGYEQIAAIFLETAEHEKEHARQHLNFIQTSDVELETLTYPVKGVGDTLHNLETAAAGEHYEQTTMYPDFAEKAEEEGFSKIARMFRDIAGVEALHEKRFNALLKNVKEGKVFKKDAAVKWICRTCGYMKADTAPPETCPICELGSAYFEIFGENY